MSAPGTELVSFYPNHRACNPHPGDGLDPLLGPRIFRALRLGPFEGFPASAEAIEDSAVQQPNWQPPQAWAILPP
jgi:hypothetical protein